MKTLRNYIAGSWDAPEVPSLPVTNPATGSVLARVPLSGESEVDAAVRAARSAFPTWSATPAAARVAPLFSLREALIRREHELVRTLVAENGKSLADARAEIKRAIENLETACAMPLLQQGDKMVGCSTGIDGEVLRVPRGVLGLITPFNFPAMVPFWFLPYAVACGCTVVLKCSELTPCTVNLVTECLADLDLPPGVVNVVHGDRTAAAALAEHEGLDCLAFVGSTAVARHVYVRSAEKGRPCLAMGGAKNHLVAMPDADLDQMIRNMVTSCYGCAGQRCMASSAIVAVGERMYAEVCERFVDASRAVTVGNPLDPALAEEPVLLGPVISAAARDRIHSLIEAGIDEGATLALDGRGLTVPGCENGSFVGPTVFTDVRPGTRLHHTEIFGPVVVVLKATDLDDAIRTVNSTPFGNGGAIYTASGYYARRFTMEADCGMIGVNVGIPAPVAFLPFGGVRNSLFGSDKSQGRAVVDFLTQRKIVTTRYWPPTALENA